MKTGKHHHQRWITLALAILMISACGGQDSISNARKAKATREIGEAYMRQGDYTAALRELTEAKRLNPEDPIVHFDLGVCYMTKKMLPDAITSFKRAISLKPTYAPARNNLGTAYLAAREWDAAIDVFKEITRDALYATPHYPLSNMGYAYYQKGQYKTALSYYKQALKIQDNFVHALRGAGRTYLAMNNGRMALRYLTRAVKLAPKMAETHFDLGEANLLVGRTQQAIVSYQTAIDLAPPESEIAIEATERLRSFR